MDGDGKTSTWTCDICSQPFRSRGGRNKHRLKAHPGAPRPDVNSCATGKLICGKCGPDQAVYKSQDELCKHLNEEHEITAMIFSKEFQNTDEFDAWKTSVETDTQTDFCCRSSTNDRKMFTCFRSGSYEPKSQAKRCAKNVPTIKSGFSCCAFIRVKIHDDGKVTIRACIDHYGHDLIAKIQHPKAELKSRVVELVTTDNRKPAEVLRIVRDEAPADKLHKNHLLTADNIRYIMTSLQLYPERRSQDDFESIDLRIAEEAEKPESPFFAYKPYDPETGQFALGIQTEKQREFMLKFASRCVCMDSSHNVSQWDLLLMTVMVVDDFDCGFPVAWLLFRREAEGPLRKFFEALKMRVGELKPRLFMSDDASAFWNAWTAVFGSEGTKKMLCSWHVWNAWDRNSKAEPNIIRDKNKRKEIMSCLKRMQRASTEAKFNSEFTMFLTLTIDELVFREYFKDNYMNRQDEWATFARLRCFLNCNMFLEAFHRMLKVNFLNNKENARLDTLIEILFKIVPYMVEKHALSVIGPDAHSSSKFADLHRRHKNSYEIPEDNLSTKGPNKWGVKSADPKKPDMEYTVRREQQDCECKLRCRHLNCYACAHMYSCDCPDATTRFICCKHMHFVHYQLGIKAAQDAEDQEEDGNVVAATPIKVPASEVKEATETVLANCSRNNRAPVTHEDVTTLVEKIKTVSLAVTDSNKLAAIHERLQRDLRFAELQKPKTMPIHREVDTRRNHETQNRCSFPKRKRRKPQPEAETELPENQYCGQCHHRYEDDEAYELWVECPDCMAWFHQICVERIIAHTTVDNFMCGRCLMEPTAKEN